MSFRALLLAISPGALALLITACAPAGGDTNPDPDSGVCNGTATTWCDPDDLSQVFAINACGEVTGVRSECDPGRICTQRTPTSLATCALPDFQASLIARVNQLRAAGASCGSNGNFAPAAALTWNTQLTQAATAHSLDMVRNNFFDHTGSNGSTLSSRVNATGYAWSGLGENIAAGYGTVSNVMTGWMASPGHCANIMNPAFTQIGVACIKGTSTNRYGDYWTMDLGRPQ